jgi:hypothetical protein
VYTPTDYSVLAGWNAQERDEWRAYAKKLERDLAALRRGIVERDRAIAQRDESIGRLKATVAVTEDRVAASVRRAMASNAALSTRMLEGVSPALAERIAADEAAESERTAKRVEQTRQALARSMNARH